MWLTVARKEIKTMSRDKTVYAVTTLLWLLVGTAALVGYGKYTAYRTESEQARNTFRSEWVEQQTNPHSAAHFGTYIFKPATSMDLYDNGLGNYLGTTYRVEAHYQHPMSWSPAEDTGGELRFGELTVARIFQLLVPLFIILLGFASISREKEQNTLRLLLSQGVSPAQFLWGKIAGIYFSLLMILLPVLLLLSIGVGVSPPSDGLWERFFLWAGSYLIFFLIITAWVCLVSALSRRSAFSLLICLAGWVLLGVVLPRAAIDLANRRYTLPSRHELNEKMDEGFSEGLEGDLSRDERQKAYEKKILAQYGADSVQNLPLNFDGLAMQMGEDYQSKVFKRYSTEIERAIVQQQSFYEMAGFVNPFVAIQQLSMSLAGTDYSHHVHFIRQAQHYRDEFMRVLNLDMAYGGSKYLTYDYEVGPDFFKKMRDFDYPMPNVGWVMKEHQVAGAALLFCLLCSILLVIPLSKLILR